MYPRSMADSDCVMVMGSNMAECHPVAFRWPMEAKAKGATLIHTAVREQKESAARVARTLRASLSRNA
jgi:formate dehydrogenase major subunit